MRSGSFQLPDADGSEPLHLKLDSVVSRVIHLERGPPKSGNRYYLNIRGRLLDAEPWADTGYILVSQQFLVDFAFEEPVVQSPSRLPKPPTARLVVAADENSIRVLRDTGAGPAPFVVLDKQTGEIRRFSPRGMNVLSRGILPNFTRASTDNDKGGIELAIDFLFPIKGFSHLFGLLRGYEDFSYDSHWRTVGLDEAHRPRVICRRLSVKESGHDGVVDIMADCSIVHSKRWRELFQVTVRYLIFSDERVRISQHVVPQSPLRRTASIARVGVNFQIDPSLYHIQYFGRGPGENYPDRKSGSEIGVFTTTPNDMGYLKYIVPGENGSRSDCEWIAFSNDDGEGVCIVSAATDSNSESSGFCCSALLHSSDELHVATHTCDLGRRENGVDPIHVNVDHKLMGVGGDNRYVAILSRSSLGGVSLSRC